LRNLVAVDRLVAGAAVHKADVLASPGDADATLLGHRQRLVIDGLVGAFRDGHRGRQVASGCGTREVRTHGRAVGDTLDSGVDRHGGDEADRFAADDVGGAVDVCGQAGEYVCHDWLLLSVVFGCVQSTT